MKKKTTKPVKTVTKKKSRKVLKSEAPSEWRMYGLVPYNISPIQQGIQFGHAVVEYADSNFNYVPYKVWSKKHKTFIILNGGTTNKNKKSKHYGTLNQHLDTLKKNGIKVATFYEPDLGDQLSAIVFLVDNRVWDKKKYPSWEEFIDEKNNFKYQYSKDYNGYVRLLGSRENVFLREFLSNFRLA